MFGEAGITLVGVLGAVVAVLVFLITLYLFQYVTSPLPPGPFPLPVVGNYLSVGGDREYEYMRKVAPRYGPVMTVYLGTAPYVVLNNYEAVRDAFVKQGNEFAGRVESPGVYHFTEGCKDIAVADFSPAWSLRRHLAVVAVKKYSDKSTLSTLVSESANKQCEALVEETRRHGAVDRFDNAISLLLYNVQGTIVFGKSYQKDDPEFQTLMNNINEANAVMGRGLLGDFVPALSFLPTPAKRQLLKTCGAFLGVFARYIAEHRETLDESQPRDITDAVLIARLEAEREGKEDMRQFTDVHERQTISDIFLAGTDTTAATLLWTVLYCIHYPQLQEKVHAEIEEQVGGKTIEPDDRRRLPYTEAFLLESMRIRPIAALALAHAATTNNAKINGYHIPRGTMVVPNVWACHHDPRYWSDPDHFKPERFIKPDGSVNSKPESFLPFSLGRRACAGEHQGRINLFLLFSTLVQRVRFEVADGAPMPTLEPNNGEGPTPFACGPQPFTVKVVSR